MQVRERDLEAAALLELTERIRDAARAAAGERRVRVVVNRRCDVAWAAGVDGVHLGWDGLAPADARRVLGPTATLGVSTHAPAEVARLRDADYAHLAPVFAPRSKAPGRPPLGLAALTEAARSGLPVLAQGGIDASNAAAACRAGAAGVAVTGAILMSDDPGAAAAALRRALDAAPLEAP